MSGEPRLHEKASVRDSFERVSAISEQLVRDRLRLLEHDAKQLGAVVPRLGGWFLAGALAAVGTWFGLVGLAVELLHGLLSLRGALATVAGFHAALAVFCVAMGWRASRGVASKTARLKQALSVDPAAAQELS